MIRFCVIVLSLMIAATAWAQEKAAEKKGPDPRVTAASALQRGNSLASKGKYADAVGYYEKALRLDPVGSELAYYNLAEVQKVRGNCRAAVLMWQMYASVLATEASRKEADAGLKGCKADGWPKLEIKVEPTAGGEVFINGILASTDGVFGPLIVPPGKYEVRLTSPDHHPTTVEVEVKAQDVAVTETLKKMTFFGTLRVSTSVEGAQIRVYAGASDKTEGLADTKSPMKDGVKVREGRHFVEVTADGYDRWIRNVEVGRDVDLVVEVELRRSLPPEIR